MKLNQDIKSRLTDMGLTLGTEILLLQKAPLGNPLWLLVRDYHLIIRKEYASMIEIELLDIDKKGEQNEVKDSIDRQSQ